MDDFHGAVSGDEGGGGGTVDDFLYLCLFGGSNLAGIEVLYERLHLADLDAILCV